jgi:hypothetical protein
MKYYYNGKLVRSSKNSSYKYAVMLGGFCKSCSSSLDGARSAYSSIRNEWQNSKQNFEDILAGKCKRPDFLKSLSDDDLIRGVKQYENMINNLQIVELEARA